MLDMHLARNPSLSLSLTLSFFHFFLLQAAGFFSLMVQTLRSDRIFAVSLWSCWTLQHFLSSIAALRAALNKIEMQRTRKPAGPKEDRAQVGAHFYISFLSFRSSFWFILIVRYWSNDNFNPLFEIKGDMHASNQISIKLDSLATRDALNVRIKWL